MKKLLLSMALCGLLFSKGNAQVLNLDGTGNSVTSSYSLNPALGFTIEYTVKFNAIQNYNGTIFQGNSYLPGPIDVYVNGFGQMGVLFGDGNGVSSSYTASYTFVAGRYYHITHTYNPSTFSSKLFVDGVLVHNQGGVSGLSAYPSSSIFIGNRQDNATDANETFKDFRIWAGEVSPNMSTCLTGSEADLEVYYKFDEASGTTVTDYAAAAGSTDGTINGSFVRETLGAAAVSISTPSIQLAPGSSAVFTASASGNAFNNTYDWYKNGVLVAAATGASYTVNPVNDQDSIYAAIHSETPCALGSTATSNGIEMSIVIPENELDFDGFDDYLNTPLILNASTNVTIEGWIKSQLNNTNTQCLFYNGNSGNSGYGLYLVNNQLQILHGGVTMNFVSNLNSGWSHLAMVNDGANWKVYVNGILKYTGADAPNAPIGSSYIGGSPLGENFIGQMEDVRFWSVARTQSQIQDGMLCNNVSNTSPGLEACYTFNQGNASSNNSGITSVIDQTGNGHAMAGLNLFTLNNSQSNFINSFMVFPLSATAIISADANFIGQTGTITFTADPFAAGSAATYQWYLNGNPVGTNSNTYSTNTLQNRDTVYCVLTSSFACVTGSDPSNSIVLFQLPPNSVLYVPGDCYDHGDLSVCDPYNFDYGNFYNPYTEYYGTAIYDAQIISTGNGDAYDGAFELIVNDTVFTDVDGTYLDTLNYEFHSQKQQLVPGINAVRSIRIYEHQPILRFTGSFENTSNASKTIKVQVYSNLGSDNSTFLEKSFSDSTYLLNADRWMITSDDGDDGDPINTHVRFGGGAIASHPIFSDYPEDGNGYYGDTLLVTIPAHSTRHVVMFNRLDPDAVTAIANVGFFNDLRSMLDSNMFAGIDSLSNIVNWNFDQPVATFSSSNTILGCDSALVSFTNTSTLANTYNWYFGDGSPDTTTMSPDHAYAAGTYSVALTATNDNTLTATTYTTVTVNAIVLDLSTSVTGSTVTANATGVTYQWLDCNNAMAVVSGENSQSFTPAATGNYAVIIANGSCVDTSACVAVTAVGLKAIENTTGVAVYPNPAKDQVTVSINETVKTGTIEVIDLMGRLVISKEITSNKVNLNIADLKAGVYEVRIVSANNTAYQTKLIKQ